MTPSEKDPLRAGIIKRLHVNQSVLRANRKTGAADPPLTIKAGGANTRCTEAVIYGQDGLPAARLVYSPDRPLSCGARLWIETTGQVDAA